MQKGFAGCLQTPKSDAAGNQSRERLQEDGLPFVLPEFRCLLQKSPQTDQTRHFPSPHFAIRKNAPGKESNTLQVQHSTSVLPACSSQNHSIRP